MSESSRIYWLDLAERVVWTLLQGAAGFFIDHAASGEVTWRGVAYAGLLALAKAIAARSIGSRHSAATLPQPPDMAAPDLLNGRSESDEL